MASVQNEKSGSFHPGAGRKGWIMAGMIGLVLLACWPALKNGFIWDDDLMLTDNPLIKSPGGLRYFWFSTAPTDYLPLTYSSFWLEWRLWGMNAVGYHLVNLLFHAANAILLWRILARLKIPGALFAALLFALHPVNVATVAWIAERKNTLSMLFVLLSVFWFLQSESENRKTPFHSPLYGLSVAAFLCSLLSKTAGVMLPVILLGLAWWRGSVQRRDLLRVLPFFAVALVMGLVTIWFQHHHALEADFPHRDFATRLAFAGWAVWFYLWKALWPVHLVPVYPEWSLDIHSLVSYLPGILFLALLIGLWPFRRRWSRPILFTLGGFIAALLPILGLLEINYEQFSWVADHWQYFSLPFICAIVAAGLHRVLAGRSERPFAVAAAVLVFVLAFLTWRQSAIYDSETLWRYTIQKNPPCWVAHNNLGQILVEHGRLGPALVEFQTALHYRPRFHYGLLGLSSTLLRMNRLKEAIAPLQELLRSQPGDLYNRFNLGTAYLETEQPQLAIAQFQAALLLKPAPVLGPAAKLPGENSGEEIQSVKGAIQGKLGLAYLVTGQTNQALASFLSSLQLQPDSPEIHYQVALILSAQNNRAAARQHLREALRLKPDMLTALNNLAWSLATDPVADAGEKSDALQLAFHAAELTQNNNPGILDTLAAASAQSARFDDAVKYAEQARSLAEGRGDTNFASEIQRRLTLYTRKIPFRE